MESEWKRISAGLENMPVKEQALTGRAAWGVLGSAAGWACFPSSTGKPIHLAEVSRKVVKIVSGRSFPAQPCAGDHQLPASCC